MSDRTKDLLKKYEENVLVERQPRSIGLFTIPEYPEFEAKRGMWSAALEAILTTLRYLAPATLLTLFWGQQSFLFKLLKHIDSAFRAIVFSSEEQKQAALQWIAEAGPVRVEHLDTVWRHGWILCRVLDGALPGVCAGHPPTRLSLKHAQAIADHYLGVEPVFSRQELESNDSLNRHQEWKLATYLDRIREALTKITPPVSKPSSQRTSPETIQVTMDYVARGSGLTAAQINHKMYFKIYPTAQQSLDPGEITILIQGPKDTYGMTVLQPIPGKAQIIRQKLLGLQSKTNYTENVLPITQGTTYLRSFGKNDMNKTYYIPKTKYDIEIDVEVQSDHAKIGYTVKIEGKYEISITSRGQSIVGSPFKMTASNNIIDILERESFCLEDGEEIDIVDVKTDRKVVLRIVDFVTEKMLLKENGCLEKISDDEAKILMTNDNVESEISKLHPQSCNVSSNISKERIQSISEKFKITVDKIIKLNRICKIFNNLTTVKKLVVATKQKSYIQPRRQEDIPDIVNSTLNEVNIKPYILPDRRDKYIIPENISVSLRIEKPIMSSYEDINENCAIVAIDNTNKHIRSPIAEILEDVSPIIDLEEDSISVGEITSSSNPFYNNFFEENNRIEKALGTFVNTEYETNNSQSEEMQDAPIKILIEKENTPSPIGCNPFTNTDYVNLERPKTPVLKILANEVKNRDDSGYLDHKSGLIPEETLSNEFINPFFMHQQMQSNPIADFIIGAPVSLPPILRAPSPDPEMESIMITTKNLYSLEMNTNQDKRGKRANEISRFDYSTPLHKNINKGKEISKQDKRTLSSNFHSLESNYTDELNLSTSSDNNLASFDKIEMLQSDRNITPKKDTWDSAYVSIDDNASTPDNNNNENNILSEISSRQNISHNDNNNGLNIEELSNMGPAEREIWETCNELNNTPKNCEEMKLHKMDVKRPIFTPIIEETDRSLSSVMKETIGFDVIPKCEIDSVTEAFAELNHLYHGYFPNSENSSTILTSDDNKLQNKEIEYIVKNNDHVDSASEDLSDMKRCAIGLEGMISEVQPNFTESVSVSRTLHDDKPDHTFTHKYNVDNKHEIQFGDEINIVLERKKYWDDRIRQIEAKSEETKLQHKKRRTTSKHLKTNDSLTKRKGKQIVKHFLGVSEHQQETHNKKTNDESSEIVKHVSNSPQISVEEVHSDMKLVEKWKKYWDDKFETERDETDVICSKTNKNTTTTPQTSQVTCNKGNMTEINKNTNDAKSKSQPLPVKQDLPEEVFKAFETSPKRFFGTSRKQILNKIDAFLGNPNTIDKSFPDTSNISHDTGLVSSRISLFHNISQTEELPYKRRKTQSLHNIYQKEDNTESIDREHDKINKLTEIKQTETSQTIFNGNNEITAEIKTKPIIDDISEKQTESISLKDKRERMTHNINNKCLDNTVYHTLEEKNSPIKQNLYIKKVKHEYNRQSQHHEKYNKKTFNKTSISKSEMDIFNKITSDESNLDKHKSCDELPKINVKSFISLYENVSKSAADLKPMRNISRTNSISSQRSLLSVSSSLGAETYHEASQRSTPTKQRHTSASINDQLNPDSPLPPPRKKRWLKKRSESKSTKSTDTETSFDSSEIEIITQPDSDKETTYLSLSDIELEIIENTPQKSHEPSPERNVVSADIDYKTRFKRAKEFFQSLEELRDEKKPRKLNECEMLLYNKSTESLENDRPIKRVKKNIKSHTMPSSEISKIWNQLKEHQKSESREHKYVKISEKFNVEDLFSDVMEGRLSRQGSLRGIPHKKAVLETFKSMENISDGKLSPYELVLSQLSDFAKENKIKTAQTYLSEYPYLPTTDPSKYHSRLDVKASGLISLKELLSQKRRRNSVPDLRLNPKFSADL